MTAARRPSRRDASPRPKNGSSALMPEAAKRLVSVAPHDGRAHAGSSLRHGTAPTAVPAA